MIDSRRALGRLLLAAGLLAGVPPTYALEDLDLTDERSWIDAASSIPEGLRRLGDRPGWAVRPYLEAELDDRRNENLDAGDEEDRHGRRLELGLRTYFKPTGRSLLTADLELADRLRRREDRPTEHATELSIKRLFWAWRPTGSRAVVLAGRQTVQDEREWLFDDELDGVGFAWRGEGIGALGFTGREARLREDLLGPRKRDGADVAYLRLFSALAGERQASLYALSVDERGFGDDERLRFLGARALGRLARQSRFWFELARVSGDVAGRRISGNGWDVGVTRSFKGLSWRPSVTVAWARGSGDDGAGADGAFRQTGLQGNAVRFDGVASVDYYGHALDPELSNLSILTAAIGIRPSRDWSVDLAVHRYRQPVAADSIRDSKLDASPDGVNRELGHGLTLTFGLRLNEDAKIEASYGVFRPGAAFDADASDIRRLEINAVWRF
jgi:alginate production protein